MTTAEAIRNIFMRTSRAVPDNPNSCLGDDGLLHCKTCGKRLETIQELDGLKLKLRCICDCMKKEDEAISERERREEIERNRKVCFKESNMHTWTFENDDHANEKMSRAMRKYAEDFPRYKKEGKGLLLYGGVGTGKTYLAACIANYLIDQGTKVLMTNFAILANQLTGAEFGDKQKFLDALNNYSLLIIDDLGAERKSDYMREIVYSVIDARYRSGKPFIITTNMTAVELKNTVNIENARIYDRIFERCIPVKVEGNSRRRNELKDSYYNYMKELGL